MVVDFFDEGQDLFYIFFGFAATEHFLNKT